MKQKVFTTILQWLVSLYCWLTVSTLFCYLAGRWKLEGKKFILFYTCWCGVNILIIAVSIGLLIKMY